MFNAVGIDVSKGKSTIAVLQPGGVVIRKPFDVKHSSCELMTLLNTSVHLKVKPKRSWSAQADTMSLSFKYYLMPVYLSLQSIRI